MEGQSAQPHRPAAEDDNKKKDVHFECNICLDIAKNPVVTMCGHLFCWSCIYRWLETPSNECPVCKSGISRDQCIPIYGRGADSKDPRESVPERPAGQRSQAPPSHNFGFPPFFFQASAGTPVFNHVFNFEMSSGSPSRPATLQEQRVQEYVTNTLAFIFFLVIMMLLIM
eukprot:c6909_g1_i2.p1 GENE.c6909_g1_i2~~c6909_g1_i2.p1  ORF type:complete len:170 (-),score=27.18 c6909_g1_i2:44-553(-)